MPTQIREYCEGLDVKIEESPNGLVIVACNQGGFDSTNVDLSDVIDWVRENKPELLENANVGP